MRKVESPGLGAEMTSLGLGLGYGSELMDSTALDSIREAMIRFDWTSLDSTRLDVVVCIQETESESK
jgi:hypothetical protein